MTESIELEEVHEERAVGGLEDLFDCAWFEIEGGRGPRPELWPRRVYDDGVRAVTLRRAGRLEGLAWARPAPGMNMIDFIYARPGPDRAGMLERLMARAARYLVERGPNRRVYAALNFWGKREVPEDCVAPFMELGMRRLDGIYLVHRFAPLPAPESAPPGYRIVPWEDARLEEVCDMMLRAPEPEPFYWDRGLCRRSVLAAGHPDPPLFRDGFGQLALFGDRVVSVCLATALGYVNHVYTDPEHQGRGLARATLLRVLHAIARSGKPFATIMTHANNPRALRLYERLGFAVDFFFPQFAKTL